MDPLHPKRRRKKTAPAPEDGNVNQFTQLALWMAASLAGMVTALLVARRPFFESLLANMGGDGAKGKRKKSLPPALRPTPEESLPLLAEAIIGNTKAAVASVFGPPRSAALRGVVKANAAVGPGYWQATTWYYPLPRNNSLAMAIEFDHDAARRVEFFRAPGV